MFGTKASTREQAWRERGVAKEEKRGGGKGSSSSQGPVAAGPDRGAGGDLQRQF